MALIDLANPTRFVALVERVLPWLIGATVIAFAVGLRRRMARAGRLPAGRHRQDHVHPRAHAWLAMFVLGGDERRGTGHAGWRHPLADVAAKCAAPLGAAFTLSCLVTGSLWGRPMWGTYWVWDARLTSVLVLFLMYLGLIALWRTVDDPAARRPCRRDADAGRRHQPSDHQILGRLVEHAASAAPRCSAWAARPSTRAILLPLVVMALAFTLLFITLHLAAMRNEILRRRVRTLLLTQASGAELIDGRLFGSYRFHRRGLCRRR